MECKLLRLHFRFSASFYINKNTQSSLNNDAMSYYATLVLTTNHWSLLVLYLYIDTLHCQGLKYNKNVIWPLPGFRIRRYNFR